jgi:hypothetical protein
MQTHNGADDLVSRFVVFVFVGLAEEWGALGRKFNGMDNGASGRQVEVLLQKAAGARSMPVPLAGAARCTLLHVSLARTHIK